MPLTKTQKLIKIYKRDRGKCWICGLERSLSYMTRDHLIPKSLGGTDAMWNIALACQPCNQERGTEPPPLYMLLKNCRTQSERAMARIMYGIAYHNDKKEGRKIPPRVQIRPGPPRHKISISGVCNMCRHWCLACHACWCEADRFDHDVLQIRANR